MTRINLVPVKTLHSKHLLAEYRELPRVFGLVEAAQKRGLCPATANIPPRYVLGSGHVTFFYDKLTWLQFRFMRLVDECQNRQFRIQHLSPPNPPLAEHWYNDWSPCLEDIVLNAKRIRERMPKS